jgi:hypothetical protein
VMGGEVDMYLTSDTRYHTLVFEKSQEVIESYSTKEVVEDREIDQRLWSVAVGKECYKRG